MINAAPRGPSRVRKAAPEAAAEVFFWPDFRATNPYQTLLYRNQPGLTVRPGELTAARERLADRPQTPVIFHQHWLNPLFGRVRDFDAAWLAARSHLRDLADFQAAGGRVVWTIHNLFTHEATFPALEACAGRRLAAQADRVHLLSAGGAAEVAEAFVLPKERVQVARHGHFIDHYPPSLGRQASRTLLGFGTEDRVLLSFGMIRRYKGGAALIDAFAALAPTLPALKLLIVGKADGHWLDERIAALPASIAARIRVVDDFVPDSDVALYFEAADIGVFPFRRVLNSSSVMLALSFGLPLVAPSVAMVREAVGACEGVRLIDPEAPPDVLASAISSLAAEQADDQLALRKGLQAQALKQTWPALAPLYPLES